MTFLKPLPPTSAGRTFELRNKVIGVYDKGKSGTVVVTQQNVVDKATGETYVQSESSAFFVGQGNWGGPKGPATENFPPPKGKKPDAVVIHQTTPESALLYRYIHFINHYLLQLMIIDLTATTIHSTPPQSQESRWVSEVLSCTVFPAGTSPLMVS